MKTRGIAVLLALFLGGLGIHKFYLNSPGIGIIYILFCWTFIPGIIAFIEVIIMLCMTDSEFNLKYNQECRNNININVNNSK